MDWVMPVAPTEVVELSVFFVAVPAASVVVVLDDVVLLASSLVRSTLFVVLSSNWMEPSGLVTVVRVPFVPL